MKTVYLGYSIKKVNDIKNELDHLGIVYRLKENNRNTNWLGFFMWTFRTYLGRLGSDKRFETQYEILVDAKDYDQAMYHIRKNVK